VSSAGFDQEAIAYAEKVQVYCVLAQPKDFEFVGDIKIDFELNL
jgi:hypothetical protein